MCRICFSVIHLITSKVKVYFCKHKPDINKLNSTNSSQMLPCPFLNKILKLWGSSVDNSVNSAWNDPNFWRFFFIKGRTQHNLHVGVLLIHLLLIVPRIIIIQKTATMPSLLVRTFSFWRESDFYGKKKEKKK